MSAIVVRHATTKLNSEQKDEDRVRGWMDVPLDAQGHRIARIMASRLAPIRVDHLYVSDFTRTRETAQYWLQARPGLTASYHRELRPWNMGDLAGQLYTDVAPILDSLIANPHEPAPGGESFHAFLSRYLPFVLPLIMDDVLHGVITHSRDILALEAYLQCGSFAIPPEVWDHLPAQPPGAAKFFTWPGPVVGRQVA